MIDPTSVIVDNASTGRSGSGSVLTEQKLIEVLDGFRCRLDGARSSPGRVAQSTFVSSTSGEANARADRSS